jgi:hypothetical protein
MDCGCQPARRFVCPPHQIAALEARLAEMEAERDNSDKLRVLDRAEGGMFRKERDAARAKSAEVERELDDARAEAHRARVFKHLSAEALGRCEEDVRTLREALGLLLAFLDDAGITGGVQVRDAIDACEDALAVTEGAK